MSSNSNSYECSKCEETFRRNPYEVDDEIWCEECYINTYYPQYKNEMCGSNEVKQKVERCDRCDFDLDDFTELECSHKFCDDCMEHNNKTNKCPKCLETIEIDKADNFDICKACYRQFCDCICDYNKRYLNKEKLFYNALFIKYHKTVNHKVIRKIIEMFENNEGFRCFDLDFCGVNEININKENDNSYIVSIYNYKYENNRFGDIHSERTDLKFTVYTEAEIMTIYDFMINNNIHIFDPKLLYYSIKKDTYKQIIKYKPEKVFNNDCCPVCLDDYNNNKKISQCGHTICMKCYDFIINSNKPKCPECRTKWSKKQEDEYIEYTLEDIEELCENKDDETLHKIIDINELKDNTLSEYGPFINGGFQEYSTYTEDDVEYKNETPEDINVYVSYISSV